ncbi:hypothetical protein BGW36DRAFT_401851 [Talaromyces proteolyticus]|uniref:Cyclase n=1 Tax=Talaromyces proteolyticus TaxID=1131652 RepID=A0AAD4PUL4_9EURO|nr:uncharacterized protein BGW36DRAFT_401851 [Talaromyces proteolyticus]KAH8689505.1 hypothetical protein BGW36DRAFT_401851 [Talaromyces proteolyticus]
MTLGMPIANNLKHNMRELLTVDALPNPKRVWQGEPNSRDEGLGRLVILTPEIVKAATGSIKSGRRVSLSWGMDKLDIANFNRHPSQHHVVPLMNGSAFDDIYIFNPQQSSQWDGLRHFSAPSINGSPRRVFYGGVESSEIMDRRSTRIGLQYWAKEGICGRGVLLDYVEYAARREIKYSLFSDHAIPLSILQDIAKEQGVTFQYGDLLFVRIGLVQEWDTRMTMSDKINYASSTKPLHAGVEGTEEMLRWIWDTGFAAVASDAISFEVFPPQKSYPRKDGDSAVEGVFMHEVILAGWGMPIGELFDLEGLAQICREEKRWEFFIASAPLNMPGGISTPPNCIAIF